MVEPVLGDKLRPVDYFIDAHFKLQDGKIVEQKDEFGNISELEFAKMAFGYPQYLDFLLPLFRNLVVKSTATKRLKKFMKEHGY